MQVFGRTNDDSDDLIFLKTFYDDDISS